MSKNGMVKYNGQPWKGVKRVRKGKAWIKRARLDKSALVSQSGSILFTFLQMEDLKENMATYVNLLQQ